MTGTDDIRVAVVGGGIGGLAAALFCKRAGVRDVSVFEQSRELREIGVGIQVAPNAVRLLRRLGLGEAVASPTSSSTAATCSTCCTTRPPTSGSTWATVRGDRQGRRRGRRGFENGATVRADAVVGADGIHSVVHDSILPPEPATFSGLAAYRALVPASEAPDVARRPVTTLWLGPDRHFVHYPVSAGAEINIVSCNPAGDFAEESWTADGRVDDLAGTRAVVTATMMPVVALALWATGGANSFLPPVMIFTALFVGYFFEPRYAWPLIALFVVAYASPLLYDARAVDPLTGLANRRAFDVSLERAVERCALVVFDFDGFKAINDTHVIPSATPSCGRWRTHATRWCARATA